MLRAGLTRAGGVAGQVSTIPQRNEAGRGGGRGDGGRGDGGRGVGGRQGAGGLGEQARQRVEREGAAGLRAAVERRGRQGMAVEEFGDLPGVVRAIRKGAGAEGLDLFDETRVGLVGGVVRVRLRTRPFRGHRLRYSFLVIARSTCDEASQGRTAGACHAALVCRASLAVTGFVAKGLLAKTV